MTLQCLVIDDEPRAITVLKKYIEKVSFLTLCGTFRDPLKALDHLQEENVDLIFLDIQMPNFTGLQLLNTLPNPPMIIFTTAYPEFAVKGYDYDAIDYLLKPIEFERFLKAVNKALKQYQLEQNKKTTLATSPATIPKETGTILLKSGSDIHQLKIDDILYIESAGNYVLFVTVREKVMTLLTMAEALAMVPVEIFVRVHRSYIVALKHISLIERHDVRIGEKIIPIGNYYRETFMKSIKNV